LQPRDAKPKRRRRNKGMCLEDRPVLEPNAAGIDVGAREMFVAVPPGRDENPVRVFATFTEDLERLTDWLEQCGVTTVALESTGVYWIPLFEILEQRGIRPCLVNARHMKNVPGRRTDWHECQWLQFLHSVGLLRAAFRPGQDICAVRTVLRHRNELVSAASQHVQHMHKALTQMNLQIHHVISDITGLTGRAIVDAIPTGRRRTRQAAGSTHQSRHRHHPKIAGRQLAARASVYPRSIARSVPHLSATDRELRSGNREDAAAVRAPHRPREKTVATRPKTISRRKQKEKEERASRIPSSICVPKPINSWE